MVATTRGWLLLVSGGKVLNILRCTGQLPSLKRKLPGPNVDSIRLRTTDLGGLDVRTNNLCAAYSGTRVGRGTQRAPVSGFQALLKN